MSTHRDDEEPAGFRRAPHELSTTAQVRTPTRQLATSGLESTIVTAEIPVTAARARPRHVYASQGDDVLLPAPVGLRLAVWVLFFIFLIALVALAVEHFHPDWLSFLQNGSTTASRANPHALSLSILR